MCPPEMSAWAVADGPDLGPFGLGQYVDSTGEKKIEQEYDELSVDGAEYFFGELDTYLLPST